MFFFAITWALAWYWIIARSYDKYATFCENQRAAGDTKPTWNYIKSVPGRIDRFVDEVNSMFWFGG